jgi:hypothetical protein
MALAIGYDVEACGVAAAGKRKAERRKSHHNEQKKHSERFHKRSCANLSLSMVREYPSYSIVQRGDIAIERHQAYDAASIPSITLLKRRSANLARIFVTYMAW